MWPFEAILNQRVTQSCLAGNTRGVQSSKSIPEPRSRRLANEICGEIPAEDSSILLAQVLFLSGEMPFLGGNKGNAHMSVHRGQITISLNPLTTTWASVKNKSISLKLKKLNMGFTLMYHFNSPRDSLNTFLEKSERNW